MSDLYNQIVSERGSFESLLARIPGFRGYVDKGARRTADRMLRDYVAGLLTRRIQRLVGIEGQLLDSEGGFSFMGKTANVKMKLQTFHDRVSAAAPGYSGFAEAVKVGPEELERIYSFDEAMIRYMDKFDEALTGLEGAVNAHEGIDAALAKLDAVTTEANQAFALREDVLINLNKSLST